MGDNTKIEWSEATWNPVTGCTKVSPGCAYCYIEHTPPFRIAGRRFVKGAIPLQFYEERLMQPLRWTRPRRIFVNSLSDLFHEDVPDEFIDRVFAVMALAPQHVFQVLTKRPERMREYFSDPEARVDAIGEAWYAMTGRIATGSDDAGEDEDYIPDLPLPNVWLGVTVENQVNAEKRIPALLETPAAVRWLSMEPLIGPVQLSRLRIYTGETPHEPDVDLDALTGLAIQPDEYPWGREVHVDWVVVGGESNGPAARRLVMPCTCNPEYRSRMSCSFCHGTGWQPKPTRLEWVQSIRRECQSAGVPFFFKQWGGPRPKAGGRLLDGRTWDEFPEVVHAVV